MRARLAAGALLAAVVLLLPAVAGPFLRYLVLNMLLLALLALSFNLLFGMTGPLAFGMLVYAVVWKWTSVTGGDDGLIGIPRGRLGLPGPLDVKLDAPVPYYFFASVLVLLSMGVLHRLSASPLGLSLRAIRENAERAESSGIPVRRTIYIAFVTAGLFAGLSGALLAPLEQTVSPSTAHWTKSAEPVMATLIGGPLSYFGP